MLNLRCSNTSISARGQLRGVGCVGCGAKDVADLGRFRERVQVGRSCRMARGACRVPSGLRRRLPRSRMRSECAGSLQLRALSTRNENPRRFDGCAWPSVARVTCLEDRQDLLSALCGIAGYYSEVLRTQFDLAGLGRHVLIVHVLILSKLSVSIDRAVCGHHGRASNGESETDRFAGPPKVPPRLI